MDRLTALVVRYWPARLLEAAGVVGRRAKAVQYILTLLRAQVRERWEAEYGIGPLWDLLLAGTVDRISSIVLGLWWDSREWRDRLRQMAAGGD